MAEEEKPKVKKAKPAGKAAGESSAKQKPAEAPAPPPAAKPAAPKKSGRLLKKNKSRLPRKLKKQQKKAALA